MAGRAARAAKPAGSGAPAEGTRLVLIADVDVPHGDLHVLDDLRHQLLHERVILLLQLFRRCRHGRHVVRGEINDTWSEVLLTARGQR